METRVVFIFPAYNTYVFTVYDIELIIVNCLMRFSYPAPVGLESKSNSKGFIADLVSELSLYVPHGLLGIAV